MDWEQREIMSKCTEGWKSMAYDWWGEGEAGKMGELIGKHLAFQLGPGFIL